MQNFAYRASITLDVFIIAGFITIGLALLTVSWQSLKITRTDPVQRLASRIKDKSCEISLVP
jgi:putative ABC transport system permease protein